MKGRPKTRSAIGRQTALPQVLEDGRQARRIRPYISSILAMIAASVLLGMGWWEMSLLFLAATVVHGPVACAGVIEHFGWRWAVRDADSPTSRWWIVGLYGVLVLEFAVAMHAGRAFGSVGVAGAALVLLLTEALVGRELVRLRRRG